MTFWKVSDTRMNCLITQEEIEILGFHIDELMSNRERTVELLNLLAAKGKEALGMDLQMVVHSFYGAFLPDRSLLLTITCGEAAGDGEVQVLSGEGDFFARLLADRDEEEKESAGEPISCQILFSTIDSVIDFCRIFHEGRPIGSRLYEYDDIYYLMMDFEDTQQGRSDALKVAMAGEFGGVVEEEALSEVFLKEHECCLIGEAAVEKLYELEA
ncbi:adaptor protein MecA [Roseburia hominis]